MMKIRTLITTAALLATLVACSGIPVNTDFDTSRNFSALKTYTWMAPVKKLVVDPLVDNDLMSKRIQRAVEAELNLRGFVKATGDEGVDFYITYYVSSEDKISVSSFRGYYGYYPCWGGCYGYGFGFDPDIYVRHYKEGTFMLDVVDPASQSLMWRGVAGRQLSTGTPAERDDYVRAIVGAILAKFPPSAGQ